MNKSGSPFSKCESGEWCNSLVFFNLHFRRTKCSYLGANACKIQAENHFESGHLRISRFSYILISFTFFFVFKLRITPCKAEQPLRGMMELQEKEAQNDCSIQRICLEIIYSEKMSVNSRLKATKIENNFFLKNIASYWVYRLLKLCWWATICSKLFSEWNLKGVFRWRPSLHIYNACLKDDQTIKSWNITKYVVLKASQEPMPLNLVKTKSGANFRQLYLPMPSLPQRLFWWIW